jgi:hypothetical protein
MTDSIRHVGGRAACLVLATTALALTAPNAAGAVTLGSSHVAETSNAGVFCGGFPNCAYAQTSLRAATVKAPFDGRIPAWHVNLSDPGSVQLLVLRKPTDGAFKAVDGSAVRTTATAGVKRFAAALKIRKGDFVGLNLLDENVGVHVLDTPGVRSKGFLPAFDIGARQHPYHPFSSTFDELQFNAKLKR